MKICLSKASSPTPDLTKWHLWFAWHPVIVEDVWNGGRVHLVWGERICRKLTFYSYDTMAEYRLRMASA